MALVVPGGALNDSRLPEPRSRLPMARVARGDPGEHRQRLRRLTCDNLAAASRC
jgi:hypothetical protein